MLVDGSVLMLVFCMVGMDSTLGIDVRGLDEFNVDVDVLLLVGVGLVVLVDVGGGLVLDGLVEVLLVGVVEVEWLVVGG